MGKRKRNTEQGSLNLPGPQRLSLITLHDSVLYPAAVQSIALSDAGEIAALEQAVQGKSLLAVFALAAEGEPYPVGSTAIVHSVIDEASLRGQAGIIHALIQGVERIRLTARHAGQVEVVPAPMNEPKSSPTVTALAREIRGLFTHLLTSLPDADLDNLELANQTVSTVELAHLIAAVAPLNLAERQQVLTLDDGAAKLRVLLPLLQRELELVQISQDIRSQAKENLEQQGREVLLREQLKVIHHELGEDNLASEQLRVKLAAAKLPAEVQVQAEHELAQLARVNIGTPEYNAVYTYLESLASLPWAEETEQPIDLSVAEVLLDRDHYGLTEVKSRILDYLAVRKLRSERPHRAASSKDELEIIELDASPTPDHTSLSEPILCLVGPPGVGKTSLGQCIARVLGRKFVRMSLAGVHDEAEIRGHRRTYMGAMPGRIIQALQRAGVNNPVFMLDEIDKMSADFHGNPAAALLEVLDPGQNREFRDNYLEVPFDLSHVFFIATANLLEGMPATLRDRLEVVELSGYTEAEKVHIARNFLVPRQMQAHALNQREVSWSAATLHTLVSSYTQEAGVRGLEREVAAVCRRLARRIAEGKGKASIKLTPKLLEELLGQPRYLHDTAEILDRPGVAIGLAWTPVGGDIVYIEASKVPGGHHLTITGQLGEVMRESAQAALTYVRGQADQLEIDPTFFNTSDIHLHVPAAAVPKDGPSAGLTIAVALASLLTDRPVPADLAMTGEITLRGRILPVGGIREKLLAAQRAGIKQVIIPKQNERDVADLPAELRRALEIIPIERIEDVFSLALCEKLEETTYTRRRQVRLVKQAEQKQAETICDDDEEEQAS